MDNRYEDKYEDNSYKSTGCSISLAPLVHLSFKHLIGQELWDILELRKKGIIMQQIIGRTEKDRRKREIFFQQVYIRGT